MKNTIKKILKEEADKSDILYDKIASLIKNPPFVYQITEQMGMEEGEILPIMERILGMKLKVYGIGDGGDYFFHPKQGGLFVYYESWDSSDWVLRFMNSKGDIYKIIEPGGETTENDIQIN